MEARLDGLARDVVENTDRSLGGDSVKNTRPIHQEAETRAEIEQLFDGIAYGKSAAVLAHARIVCWDRKPSAQASTSI